MLETRESSICKSTRGEDSVEWGMSQYEAVCAGLCVIRRGDGTLFKAEYIIQNLVHGVHSVRLTNVYREISPASSTIQTHIEEAKIG